MMLYHFLETQFLVSLLRRNSFRTSPLERWSKTARNPAYIYSKQRFISFTRNRNPLEGYPVLMLSGMNHTAFDSIFCRVTLDRHTLKKHANFKSKNGKQHHFKLAPIDYTYNEVRYECSSIKEEYEVDAQNGKEWMMESDSYFENMYGEIDGTSSEDCDGILSDIYSHAYSQAEERLTTDVVFIPNANRYIRCVDIYVRENMQRLSANLEVPFYLRQISDDDWRGIIQIRKYCQKLNIPLHFYDSLDYFKGQRQAFEIPYSQIAETHKMYKNKLNGLQKNKYTTNYITNQYVTEQSS